SRGVAFLRSLKRSGNIEPEISRVYPLCALKKAIANSRMGVINRNTARTRSIDKFFSEPVWGASIFHAHVNAIAREKLNVVGKITIGSGGGAAIVGRRAWPGPGPASKAGP